jgi:hypothetical protein
VLPVRHETRLDRAWSPTRAHVVSGGQAVHAPRRRFGMNVSLRNNGKQKLNSILYYTVIT